jgi:hypothetical protein
MPTTTWFDTTTARLDRARKHLSEINRMIEELVAAVDNKFVIKTNPDGAVWMVWWIEGPHHLPLDACVIVGELAYNLRSALDNLVCALIRIDKPEASCSRRSFPIYTDGDDYEKHAPELLKGVPAEAQRLIKSLQPFERGSAIELDPLHILNTLCNRDKHRALRLAAGFSSGARFLVSHHTGKPLLPPFGLPRAMFADGPHIVELPLTPAMVTPYANVKATGKNQVAFLDDGPWGDRPVDEVLTACVNYVDEQVLPRFKRFFSSAPPAQDDPPFSPD